MTIAFFDGQREFARRKDELEEAALRVLSSGRYILGPEVAAFESEVASYVGTPHAVGCASGTDALWLALRSLGIGPGDSVVVPAFTFFATASAVLGCGATPVFCDIDASTFGIDPALVDDILAGRSEVHRRVGVDPSTIRAVIPVHLFGRAADMGALVGLARAHGLRVIEDAAQAFGARDGEAAVGAIGDVGCFSFFPTKNLGGFGDGGMVTTADDEIAQRLRLLRAHGSKAKYAHDIAGTNSRLDELQAAMLRVRLRYIEQDIARRTALADIYDDALGAVVRKPQRPDNGRHAFGLYTVEIDNGRDDVAADLGRRGIGTTVYYPSPASAQPAVSHLGYREGDFLVADAKSAQVLSLPLFPSLSEDEVREVARTIVEIAGR